MKMREKSKVKKMFIFDGGSISYDVGMMMYGTDLDKKMRVATPFYAFDTEGGWILFDTGWPLMAVPILEAMGFEPDIKENNSAAEQIKQIGLKPSDIKKSFFLIFIWIIQGGCYISPMPRYTFRKTSLPMPIIQTLSRRLLI